MKVPREIRKKLELIFDEAIESETGVVLYACPKTHAGYLHRFAGALRNEAALESLEIYKKGEPFYGKGIYYHIGTRVCASGFVCSREMSPDLTNIMKFIQIVFTDIDIHLPCEDATEARKQATRYRVLRHKLIKKGLSWVEKVSVELEPNNPTVTLTARNPTTIEVEEISPQRLDEILKRIEAKIPS